MNVGELFTGRLVLPAHSLLRGEPTGRLLRELAAAEHDPPEVQAARRLERLRGILTAARRLPFHAARFAAAGLRPEDLGSLDDLGRYPLLEKSELPELAASVTERRGLVRRRSAGTSGLPVEVFADREAAAASIAARRLCFGWYGLPIGAREARFWGRSLTRHGLAERLRNVLLNRFVIETRDLEPRRLDAALDALLASGARYAYGYASLIARFAAHLEASGRRDGATGLQLVVTTAEMSGDAERRWMAERFGCPVADEYGCSEVDIIAFQCPQGGRHVLAENVILEQLPPEEPGGPGELLVTDLRNRAMPLIRYRLGDLGRLADGTCACGRPGPLLESVRGRTQKQFIRRRDGAEAHIAAFVYAMEEEREAGFPIRQFQLVQLELGRFEVNLVLGAGSTPDVAALEERLRALLGEMAGEPVRCTVRVRDEIPREPGRKAIYFIDAETAGGGAS